MLVQVPHLRRALQPKRAPRRLPARRMIDDRLRYPMDCDTSSLESLAQVLVLHVRDREALVESAEYTEALCAHGDVARPEAPAAFVHGRVVHRCAEAGVAGGASLERLGGRVHLERARVRGEPLARRQRVVVREGDPITLRLRRAMIAVGCRPARGALGVAHPRKTLGEQRAGGRTARIVGHNDLVLGRIERLRARCEPREAGGQRLMPIIGGDHHRPCRRARSAARGCHAGALMPAPPRRHGRAPHTARAAPPTRNARARSRVAPAQPQRRSALRAARRVPPARRRPW